jgi:tRNA A37 threonylcarbamoyltransferase TsaD
MSYLFLDSRFTEDAHVWWVGEAGEEVWQSGGRAQTALATIARERSRFVKDLRGVCVVAGPGRFSALRVGILYVHVLARWYRVPLYSLTPDDVASSERRLACMRDIVSGAHSAVSYVAPVYDREPTITTPRV